MGLALLATLSLAGCDREAPRQTSAGFARLGEQAPAFDRARPGTVLRFPEDHGPPPSFASSGGTSPPTWRTSKARRWTCSGPSSARRRFPPTSGPSRAPGWPSTLDDDTLVLAPLAISTVAGREVPARWHLELPAQGLDLVIQAPHANRWMDTSIPYWEGEVIARDRESGEILGEGYLEMTGY